MTRFWLTPLLSKDPLILGSERISCVPSPELDTFRVILQGVHPRLLPLFKAELLLSDDDDESCGSDMTLEELELDGGETIEFDSERLIVSHCAEAFLDRVLTVSETQKLLQQAEQKLQAIEPNASHLHWIQQMKLWSSRNWEIILLREDGV
jgi:hypothetical protein